MSRRKWIGLAGLLFGATMLTGILIAGSTPNTDNAGAAQRYEAYWKIGSHQNHAVGSAFILSYACVLLVLFSAGLGWLTRRADDGPLPTVVTVAGAAGAALFGAGGNLLSGIGVAAKMNSYTPDGNTALLTENIGYFTVSVGMMLLATAVVAFSLSNRRTRLVPQWTLVLAALVALVGLGSGFTAWIGFMLLPLWSAVVGVCLVAIAEPVPVDA